MPMRTHHRMLRTANLSCLPVICFLLLAALPSSGQGKAVSVTTVSSSKNPSPFGEQITFTASVSARQQKPTGIITFKDGNATLGTGTLSNSGQATFSTPLLAAGKHAITANYAGDANVAAGKSAVLNQTVQRTPTLTKLNPAAASVAGQPTTFTAAVFTRNPAPTAGPPTGTVTFRDKTIVLGTANLDMFQQATLRLASLGPGSHSITASYDGNANFEPSTSTVLNLVVSKAVSPGAPSSK